MKGSSFSSAVRQSVQYVLRPPNGFTIGQTTVFSSGLIRVRGYSTIVARVMNDGGAGTLRILESWQSVARRGRLGVNGNLVELAVAPTVVDPILAGLQTARLVVGVSAEFVVVEFEPAGGASLGRGFELGAYALVT